MKLTGSQFQCPWCLEHFGGPVPFGRHYEPQTADCLAPAQMRAAGMALNGSGFWALDRLARSVDSTQTAETAL
jgi:hypothetical protein